MLVPVQHRVQQRNPTEQHTCKQQQPLGGPEKLQKVFDFGEIGCMPPVGTDDGVVRRG